MSTTEYEWDFLESGTISTRFKLAAELVHDQLRKSEFPEEITHAESTLKWVLALNPEADEVLQLAAVAHDIERGRQDWLRSVQFENYRDFKNEHAKIGAEIASKIAHSAGYNENEVLRLHNLVANHEKGGTDPNIQLLTDADSLSFFEFNLPHYLERKGAEGTNKKVKFMYDRMSNQARQLVVKLSETNKLVANTLRIG